jgi:methionine synthase / methylenetetrahydrofolate reductase(NADPH)
MDGAMGTYYSKIKGDDQAISEMANINEPALILQIHQEYIQAGAKLIRTNTFAANRATLNLDKNEQQKIIEAACKIAKEAAGEDVFVAGDIGPIPENSKTDEMDILEEYKQMCDIFLKEGIKIILFETFSDLTYISDLVKYIKQKSDIFIITNFCLNKNGYTSTGISAGRLLENLSDIEEIDACGFNCGIGSGHMKQIFGKLKLPKNKYIVAMPNAGYPEQFQNRMVFMDNKYYFVENIEKISEFGVHMVGGCCGTIPEYIEEIVKKVGIKKVDSAVSISEISLGEKAMKEPRTNEFYQLLHQKKKVVAVELDPPFDADFEQLVEYAHALKQSGADIITMADSPMGRSRVDSILMSVKLEREADIKVMPHVCCRDKNIIAMRSSLLGAYVNDIRNILIVTGDPVPSISRVSTTGVFDYNSIQLMDFVKEMNVEHFQEEPLYYGGALNYARGNLDKVIERMERKIKAGAKYFLTQPIYSSEDIERIAQIKKRVDTKILCGIMPLVSYRNANFIKNEITGIHVPDEIVARYNPDMTKEEAEVVGASIANELIVSLNPFADGYYFMLPFNRVSLMSKIVI